MSFIPFSSWKYRFSFLYYSIFMLGQILQHYLHSFLYLSSGLEPKFFEVFIVYFIIVLCFLCSWILHILYLCINSKLFGNCHNYFSQLANAIHLIQLVKDTVFASCGWIFYSYRQALYGIY